MILLVYIKHAIIKFDKFVAIYLEMYTHGKTYIILVEFTLYL